VGVDDPPDEHAVAAKGSNTAATRTAERRLTALFLTTGNLIGRRPPKSDRRSLPPGGQGRPATYDDSTVSWKVLLTFCFGLLLSLTLMVIE
jgi:hypothetical protein